MTNVEYSPYKAYHHIDSLRAGTPVFAQWDVTNSCNHNCLRCSSKMRHLYSPQHRWPIDSAIELAGQLKELGIRAVELTGGGEPLCYKHFNTIAAYLLKMGIEVAMVTNGSLLHTADLNLLTQFAWVRVSVDAARHATFSLLHGSESEPKVYLVPAIKKHSCIVGASFLVQPENIAEMYSFARWAKHVGFDNCRFSYAWSPKGLLTFSNRERALIYEQTALSRSLADSDFSVFTLRERLDLQRRKSYTHCYYSDLVFVIGADGNVYRCCALKSTNQGLTGSVKAADLQTVWADRGAQDVSKCPVCWMDKKNEFMEYMMKEQVRHVNFV